MSNGGLCKCQGAEVWSGSVEGPREKIYTLEVVDVAAACPKKNTATIKNEKSK